MNYPMWLLEGVGGGNLIALIAGLHVYISHLAVGGGIFLWLTDLRATRQGDSLTNDFLRKWNWVFLLTTFVFGAITGVGIWFIIGLVSPTATSSLIHTFVFGWAIEWVFFVAEIVSLLVYHFYFDRLERSIRLKLAFFYALFAWLSLVVINGILSYMLTPGAWLENGSFWSGFFNPSYFSSVVFRTFASTMMAGLFAFLVGAFQRDAAVRQRISALGIRWVLYSVAGLLPSGVWYYYSIPQATRAVNFGLNRLTDSWAVTLLVASGLIVLLALLMALRGGKAMRRTIAIVAAAAGLAWIGSFEFVREIVRKPYVIHGHLYSSSVFVDEVETVNREGYLKHARFAQVKQVTEENELTAGRELFEMQCLPCHTVGFRNDIAAATERFSWMGMMAMLEGQGKARPYMPPFFGTDAEQQALASYIVSELHGKPIVRQPQAAPTGGEKIEPHSYDPGPGDHVLLAWNDLGMHCISDCSPWFVILPPANTLEAQVIQRGDPPMVVADNISVRYSAPASHDEPSKHVKFWDHADELYGADLEPGVGLGGLGMSGQMRRVEGENEFIAPMIPVVPYMDEGGFDPFPVFTVEAFDSETGELLAATKAVAPTSTEMGCVNCHDGAWRSEFGAGVSDATARNILATHDRLEGTELLAQAWDGKPQACQACHADPAVGMEGVPDRMNLSASLHGMHANYMYVEGSDACVMCHPASEQGSTRCNRGIHASIGLGCTDCHGSLDEHAASLLRGQWDKAQAQRLAKNLVLEQVASLEEVNPRTPWVNQPDCLTCHEGFQAPTAFSAYNEWSSGLDQLYRQRLGDASALRCEACHGSPHALYAATNPFDANRDNLQPLQYQGSPWPIGSNMECTVCHEVLHDYMKDFSVHHDNMTRPVRNPGLAP